MAPMQRQSASSGAPWEARIGYTRAVRIGPYIHVAGTTAVDATGAVVAPGDPHGQAMHILGIIQNALHTLGADMQHVVRTRIYVTDVTHWEAVGRAHGAFFAEIRPASTLVEVSGLLRPELLVEIEADAILPADPDA